MNIRNCKRLIKHVYKKSREGKYIPIMFHGATGVGKTSVVDEVSLELKEELDLPDFKSINYRLSQKEQGDLIGLPYDLELVPCPYCIENGHKQNEASETILHPKRKLMEHIYKYHNEDHKEKKTLSYEDAMETVKKKYSHLIQIRTAFSVPIDLPTSGNGILHLDELNRAMKPVRDAAFELIWERKLSRYNLPPGWIIVCSVNPPTSDKYIVHELDGAMVARFCHIRFCPEVEEWNQYAAKKGLNDTVRRFIHEYPHFLGNEMTTLSHDPIFCPRTNEMMAQLIDGLDEDLVYEVAAGCIGTEAATAYMTLLNSKERPIPAEDILNNYEKVKKQVKEYANVKNNRADLLRVSIDDLVLLLSKIGGEDADNEDLEEQQVRNLHKFIEDIPKDLGVGFLKLMIHSDSAEVQEHFRQLAADKEFRAFLQKEYKHIGMERL